MDRPVDEVLRNQHLSKTEAYVRSTESFLSDAQQLRTIFLEDFQLWQTEDGEIEARAKQTEFDPCSFKDFPFEFHCNRLFESWRVALKLNEDLRDFDGEQLRLLCDVVCKTPEDGVQLARNFFAFEEEIRRLLLLVSVKNRAAQERDLEAEPTDRVEAQDPRIEILRKIIDEHPDWLERQRNKILEELKARYTSEKNGRKGIGRTKGLKIIKQIELERNSSIGVPNLDTP